MMLEKLKAFENKQPEIVFTWKDAETEAEGWVVINSLRGGAAGGGTRMRKGLNMHEVLSLAKTMEIKFTVAGPQIGGAKSGINFDPEDPRKEGVLKRWYAAVLPLLKTYYGTGGDLNVDEIREVLPITHAMGLEHCQEGIAVGHFRPSPDQKKTILSRLQVGVSKPLNDARYTPTPDGKLVVADMITGWGVAEAVIHYYRLWRAGTDLTQKRVIVQGFGNVGGAAAWYLAKMGMPIVGIIDRVGGLMKPEGFTFEEITHLLLTRDGNCLSAPNLIPYDQINEEIWKMGAEVFLPCARSRCVTKEQVDAMANSGMEVVSCGANVPFDDPEIFMGPTAQYADSKLSLLADFIANCGMARTFAFCMEGKGEMTDEAIFTDSTRIIGKALEDLHAVHPGTRGMWGAALEIALGKLSR